MNPGKQTTRAYGFLILSVIFVFVFAQMTFFKEYTELHRLRHHVAIVWCLDAMFVLGAASILLVTKVIADKAEAEHFRKRSAALGVGILAVFVSMVIQFSVWETIGKYSMFYAQQHPTQSTSEPHQQ